MPSSLASSRAGILPSSNQSATFGLIRSSTYSRTTSRIARSSSDSRWSIENSPNGDCGVVVMALSRIVGARMWVTRSQLVL